MKSSTEAAYAGLFQGKDSQKNSDVTKEYSAVFDSVVKSVDADKRTVRVLASDASIDRDNERILPSAFKNHLALYRKNPVILASHQHKLQGGSSSVVGKCTNIWLDKKGLWAVIQFADTKLGEEYWKLYRDGFQKAVSVGFMGLEWKVEAVGGKTIHTCIEAELLEISCVAVGSNRNALVKSKQRKRDFVAFKSESKYLADLRKADPNFDDNCREFADVLMGVKDIPESGCGSIAERLLGLGDDELARELEGLSKTEQREVLSELTEITGGGSACDFTNFFDGSDSEVVQGVGEFVSLF